MADSNNDEDFVTIYVDASHRWKKGEATWAFHARCSYGSLQERGEADRTVWDANIAEMYAICISIWKCFKKWPDLTGFFVNTDSKTCCHIWWDWRNTPNIPEAIKMKEDIQKAVGEKWIKVKWVKAHTNLDDARSRLNKKVDHMANKLLRRKPKE